MKSICLFTVIVLSAYTSPGQDYRTAAKAAAKNMGTALVKRDYKNFIKTTYPSAVATTDGGAEKLIKDLETQIAGMAKEGTTILAVWPGEPSAVIDTAGEIQCIVPQKMTMKMPEGKLTTQTALIALSPDKGKTWYFMDTADRSIHKMREMFPNISSRLVIPKTAEPTFVPDKK